MKNKSPAQGRAGLLPEILTLMVLLKTGFAHSVSILGAVVTFS